jgi:hypothetical protein
MIKALPSEAESTFVSTSPYARIASVRQLWESQGVARFEVGPSGYFDTIREAKRPGTLAVVRALLKQRKAAS